MPSAPRVLIAIKPRMYAEVLAFLVGQNRPRAEVSLVDPSEDLQKAAQSVRPHLVVANQVPNALREDPTPSGWGWTTHARGRGPTSASVRG
jgi:hypothetical protein